MMFLVDSGFLKKCGHYGLHATHPAAAGDWLVMQNGTEPALDLGNGDYMGVAWMLDKGLIQPEALQYITTSNWFIVNLRSLEFTIIINNTMYFTKETNERWLLASEPLLCSSTPTVGIIGGVIQPDRLVITHENTEEVVAYEDWQDLYR